MYRNIVILLLLLISLVGHAQMREIKPDTDEFNPSAPGFFPEPAFLFPNAIQKDEVIQFYESKIENANGQKSEQSQALILYCIAELNRIKGKHQKALFALLEAFEVVRNELNSKDKLVLQSRLFFNVAILAESRSASSFAMAYTELGYESFEEMTKATLQAFEDEGDEKNLLAIYQVAFAFYQRMDDHRSAYEYGDKLIRYKDFLATKQLKEQMAALKDEYEMVQQENEILLLNNQKIINAEMIRSSTRGQWAIIGGIGVLMIFVLALWSRVIMIRRTRDLLATKASQYQHEKNRAEKNELFKEQFLANVSHEIRTPMNAIMGITNILTRNKHPESQEKYLAAMHESSKNLLVLINDILDLSKLEAGKQELITAPFSPVEIVHEVYDKLKPISVEKGLGFSVEIDENVPEVLSGDGTVLNNILMNLMNNAISFTSSGSVGLKCSLGEAVHGIVNLNLEVSDTGMGIVPEKQDKILRTFVKVYDNASIQYKGSGLELAIISQLVELHGGSIRLESEPGVGTTFFLELPYQVYSETIPEEVAKPEDIKEGLKDISILLVEDNEFNVMVASNELESSISGLKLEVAGNGKIALEKLGECMYDVILMDVQMPVMDGYEATQRIRQLKDSKKDIPIIAMTANVLQQEIEKCMKEGMNEYISKPFDTDELLSKIKNLIENRA